MSDGLLELNTFDWDVIVVGAGPAGSTSAAFLAQQGVRVLVLERDTFPRFHIGESLLPAVQSVLDDLGVEASEAAFTFKRGAQFIDESGQRQVLFDFAEALPGPARHAWHVDRAKFDTMLRDVARRHGAEVRHGVEVKDFTADARGVDVQTVAGETQERLRCRYLIDATGQGRLVARRKRSVRPYQCFGKAASFAHYSGISDAAIAEIGQANDIRIMLVDQGWAWVIPLPQRRLSVGLVSRQGGIKADDVLALVDASPTIKRLTEGAEVSETQLISNFSYRNDESYGVRYACVGDSACFIDPVFSSGVSLAMTGAQMLVKRLAPALADRREADAHLMDEQSAQMDRACETFASLVHRFYNTHFVDTMLFGAPEDGDLRSSVISVFAGDVLRDDNSFARMLLSSRQHPWRDEAQERAG